ncbi:MAG: hypothetical protein JST38_18675 [Bacteroidetes bacterium]|nr:hypothetical protein [Bacteroidota bacterium]MBS1942894.1 hypothetical protein [Bacteroidota bacterium]
MRALALVMAASCCLQGIAQQVNFIIWKDNKAVGAITALRRQTPQHTVYGISSWSEMHIVKKQVVRSSLGLEYREGRPFTCFTSFRLNGTLRDSSNMQRAGQGFNCFVHPDESFRLAGTSAWTTARMYFEEPAGQQEVFVESVLRPCPLKRTAPGRYVLELPGNKVNTYLYSGGVLQEVQVSRPLVKLVFRKV